VTAVHIRDDGNLVNDTEFKRKCQLAKSTHSACCLLRASSHARTPKKTKMFCVRVIRYHLHCVKQLKEQTSL
jgi:hypothetical protein